MAKNLTTTTQLHSAGSVAKHRSGGVCGDAKAKNS